MALPLSASEVGLIVDKPFGKAQTIQLVPGFLNAGKIDAVGPTGIGIRGAWTVVDFKVAELGLTASYRPKAQEDLIWQGTKIGKVGTEYAALGAQVDWKFLVNLHVGLDFRQEKITSEITALTNSKATTTLTRPWLRAGLGFSIPTPAVSPFVRFEVAMAATKEDKTDTPDNIRKALAPQYEVALYGGIRF
ncbi:MAG: hypothetical protein LWX11_08475 [Firmicutes bacterium]|nr:hypothetical protein [Bacillota bacterium]